MNPRTFALLQEMRDAATTAKNAVTDVYNIISEYAITDDVYEVSALEAVVDYLSTLNIVFNHTEIDKDDMTGGTAIVVIYCGGHIQMIEWEYKRGV